MRLAPKIQFETRVMNLKHRPEKLESVLKQLHKSRVLMQSNIQRVDAVYGRDLNITKLFEENHLSAEAYKSIVRTRAVNGHFMTIGALGCALTHIKIWKEAVLKDKPMLIVEDDITLLDDFDRRLIEALDSLPDDFALFYLANLIDTDSKSYTLYGDTKLEIPLDNFYGGYGYMISPKAAEHLLGSVYPLTYQIDSYIMNLHV